MADPIDIKALRAELVKRVQATNRKIRRIEAQGVELAGTEFDPRRPQALIHKYNSKQVESYRRQLDAFVNRATQFVPDANGQAIPRAEWRAYQLAERQANQLSENNWNAVRDIYIPTSGMTVGQREAATKSEFPRTANPAAMNPMRQRPPLNPGQVQSRDALRKLTKQQMQKATPEYSESFIKASRKQFKQIMAKLNAPDIAKAVDGLTSHQFHILWTMTNFANNLSHRYIDANRDPDAKPQRYDEKIEQDDLSESRELVNWSKTLPKESGKSRKRK